MPADRTGMPPVPTTANLRQALVLGLLALCVALLSIDFQGVIRVPLSDAPSWGAVNRAGRALLDKEYPKVVDEIRDRNNLEQALFQLKFYLAGGTLFLLFQHVFQHRQNRLNRSVSAALLSWAAVVVASIIDLRMMANQAFIATAGLWVRNYERVVAGRDGLGWEFFLADQLTGRAFYPALRISGQVLTALLFLVTFTVHLFPLMNRRDNASVVPKLRADVWVSCAGALLSIVLMTVAAVNLGRTPWAAVLYIGAGMGAAACVIQVVRWTKRGNSAHPASSSPEADAIAN